MRSINSLISFAICTALMCNLLQAKDASNAFKWLSQPQELALSATVPPPPAVNSPQDQADYQKILEAQKARTPEIVAECKRDEGFSYKLFESIYGEKLTSETAPKFHKLLKTVMDMTGFINGTSKEKYKRLRPYQEHPDTVKALFTVHGYSYPSGHSMGSFTLAVVLGAIFPDKKQAFLDRAEEIAQSRVNAGVHNPTDIQEGEILGKTVGAAILANSTFQIDLADVQAGLKK